MQRLNAIDAIAPAWTHTERLLLGPRKWRLLLKIGAVAVFAEMGGCNAHFNSPGRLPHHGISPVVSAAIVGMLLLIGIAALLLALVFFYIGSRLQFVLFEVVVRRDTWVGPIWARYGGITWRWIGFKLLFFLLAMVCLTPLLAPFLIHFVHVISSAGGHPDFGSMLGVFLEFFGVIFVAVLIFTVGYRLILDFGLPSLALEGAPMGESVRRILRLVRGEPGQVALYLFMRFLLGFAWAIGAYIALFFVALLLLIPLGGIGFVVWLTLHHASGGAYALMWAGLVGLALVLAVLMIVAGIMLFGYCFTFLQAYAIYFLGGRYPLLGNLIEPGPGAPFTPPPVFPSAEERKDSDGGPPMPMNPAVA